MSDHIASNQIGRALRPGSHNSTSQPGLPALTGPFKAGSHPPEPVPVIEHKLYFGLRRLDGTLVPEAVWQAFEAENLPACFPRGYTVFDGTGFWQGPEPSKVVVAYVPNGQRFAGVTLAALALCWKHLAQQACVLSVRSHAVAYEL